MDELYGILAELCEEIHPDRVADIAQGIAKLQPAEGLPELKGRFGSAAGSELYERLLGSWRRNVDVSAKEIAAALRGTLAYAKSKGKEGAVELVWSGPSTGFVPVRHTEQVICEVIDGAQEEIFITSFVAYKIKAVVNRIQVAMHQGVRVSLLVELSKEHGGTLDFDSLKHLKAELPDASFYTWIQDEGVAGKGSVHAKCVVADSKLAFVTSANLTEAAMERNMEVGLLIRGGHVPKQLHDHLKALVNRKLIQSI